MFNLILSSAFFSISVVAFSQSDSANIYYKKGLDEKAKGRRLESLKQFEKAYGYNNADKQVVSELAAAYLDLRHYAKAKEKFLQLEKMGVKTDSTYRQLMLLSYNMRQWDEVIQHASSLKKINKSEPTAFYLAQAFYGKEDLGNAIKYYQFAAKENPQNADIPYNTGRAYAEMFNYQQAVEYFQKAIGLNPNQPRWIYEMALIYYAIPDNPNALKYMLEAGEKGYKKDNEYLQNLAVAYLNAGKPGEGIGILKEMLQKRPSDANIIGMLAEAHYDVKKYDEAIGYYDQLLAINKNDAESLYMIGLSFQKKGEKQKGQALCDEAIRMKPELESLRKKKEM